MLSPLLGSKLALGIAVGAVALGGTSAAAFTANLPAPAQNAAHRLLGAPTAETSTTEAPEQDEATPTTTPTATSSATPVGPDATGSAAFGLCTAWTAQQADGATTNPTAVAFRNLATAAGGAANVPAYCATVVHPGSAMSHPTGSPTTHPNARPTSHPTGSPTTHPKARSTSHPTGSPATHPAGRPSGHPANR